MCINTYIQIHNLYIYVHIYMYIYIPTRTHTHIYIYTCIYTRIYRILYNYIIIYICICNYIYIHHHLYRCKWFSAILYTWSPGLTILRTLKHWQVDPVSRFGPSRSTPEEWLSNLIQQKYKNGGKF